MLNQLKISAQLKWLMKKFEESTYSIFWSQKKTLTFSASRPELTTKTTKYQPLTNFVWKPSKKIHCAFKFCRFMQLACWTLAWQENCITQRTIWLKTMPVTLSVGSWWEHIISTAKSMKLPESISRRPSCSTRVSSMLGLEWPTLLQFKTSQTKPCQSTEQSSDFSPDAPKLICTWEWSTFERTTSRLPLYLLWKPRRLTQQILWFTPNWVWLTSSKKITDNQRTSFIRPYLCASLMWVSGWLRVFWLTCLIPTESWEITITQLSFWSNVWA